MKKVILAIAAALSLSLLTACGANDHSDTDAGASAADAERMLDRSLFSGKAATSSQRAVFLARAQEIEEYEENIESASMSQAEMNMSSGEVFEKWDDLLNEVYDYLHDTMSTGEFSALEDSEMIWIAEKEAAQAAAADEYAGGSMAPLAYNTTGTEYTKERCYYLIYLVD